MDDQNNNPGNNTGRPSPITGDEKLSDEKAGDERPKDAGEETGGTDGQPQGTNQEGGGQEDQGRQPSPSGGVNQRAFDNLSDKTNKRGVDFSKGGQPVNKGISGSTSNAGRMGKGAKAAKAGRAAQTAGRAGMTAARAGAVAAAPETLGGSLAAQGGIELGKQAWMFAKQGPTNYFRNKEQTLKKAPQTAQKWVIGCGAAFTSGLFLMLIFFVSIFSAITLFLFPSTPSQANPPQPVPQSVPATGISFPPNLGPCIPVKPEYSYGVPGGEYCRMPDSTDGSYVMHGRRWGSKDIIGVLYTVAQRWKKKYPKGYLIINDISARLCPYHPEDRRCGGYHISHAWGVTVDLVATTDGKDCVASMVRGRRCNLRPGNYNADATVVLGQYLIDTGFMHKILHNAVLVRANYIDPRTGITRVTTVDYAIFDYAKYKYPNRFKRYSPFFAGDGIVYVRYHEDHFHLYIDRDQNNYKNNSGGFFGFSNVFNKSKLKNCVYVSGVSC